MITTKFVPITVPFDDHIYCRWIKDIYATCTLHHRFHAFETLKIIYKAEFGNS